MTDLKITKDNNNICVYERLNDDCIRLLHMYGKNPVCVVPDMLAGMRVTELAEYCFSFKSMPEKLKTELGIDDILRPDMTELCDDYIERVILPDGMQKIGRLCFYNCSRLSVLELPSDICDVDGDAFMNCTKLYMLVMRGSPKDKSCLKQILSQISTLVRVRWADSDGNAIAQACFFEYDQTYDEIGPAHIFKLNMNGEGFRARQAFMGRVFVWKQYDEIFSEAIAQESEDDLLDMAFYRLIYAYELSKEARQQFLEYIVNHKKRLSELIIRKRDSGLLQSFLELKDDEESFIADVLAVTDMLALAAQDEWSEGSVILHRFKKENLSVSRKRRFEF